jgi:hypothetical protein
MKKIFISILAASAIFAGCNAVLIEETETGYGQLALDLSASGEYEAVAKSSSDDTKLKNEDVNEFIIKLVREGDGLVKKFDRFGDMAPVIQLPSGKWTIKASSPDTLPAAFRQPIYGTSHTFDVKVGEVSSEKLVCTLQNVKFSFNLSDAFLTELKDYTITVSNGDGAANKLYWTNVASEVEDSYTTKDMTVPGYFTAAPLITIHVDAKRKADGSEAYHEIALTDAKAKDHIMVNLGAKVTGQAGFQITIDPSVNSRDEEANIPGFDEDPVEDEWDTPVGGGDNGSGDNGSGDDNTGSGDDNTGSGDDNTGDVTENPIVLEWIGKASLPEVTEIEEVMDVNLKLTSPDGIGEFKIMIESETPAFLSLVTYMTSSPRETDSSEPVTVDLINDKVAIGTFSAVGLKTGEALTGEGINEVTFALSDLVPMIPSAGEAGPDTYHTFTLIVGDKKGKTNQWSLTFHVPADYEG